MTSSSRNSIETEKAEELCRNVFKTNIPKAILNQLARDSKWNIIFTDGPKIGPDHMPTFDLTVVIDIPGSIKVNTEPTLELTIRFKGNKKTGNNKLCHEALYIIERCKLNLSFEGWETKRNLLVLKGNFRVSGFPNSATNSAAILNFAVSTPSQNPQRKSPDQLPAKNIPSKLGYEEVLCFDGETPVWKYFKRELTDEEKKKLQRLPFNKIKKYEMIRASSVNFASLLKDININEEQDGEFLYSVMASICNNLKVHFEFELFDWPKLDIIEEARDKTYVVLNVFFPHHFRISERNFMGAGMSQREAIIDAAKDFLRMLQYNIINESPSEKPLMTEEEVKALQREFDKNQKIPANLILY